MDRLAEREVTGIVAVPLFISSHSSVIRATEYLLGKRDDAPPQMEAFARMSARHAGAHGGTDPRLRLDGRRSRRPFPSS